MTKEERAAYNKAYQAENREKLLAKKKVYNSANREQRAAYNAAHPNERLAVFHKVRAKKAGVKIGDTKSILAWIKGWKTEATVACHYCMSIYPGKAMTIDHVIPMSAGGNHDLNNLVVCCSFCNCSKKDKLPAEWLARTG